MSKFQPKTRKHTRKTWLNQMKKMKAPETDYKETQIVSQLTNKINFLIFLVRYIHHLKADI